LDVSLLNNMSQLMREYFNAVDSIWGIRPAAEVYIPPFGKRLSPERALGCVSRAIRMNPNITEFSA
jgi:hypothetical protein